MTRDDYIQIDGSTGEGGGQILRSSLAMSAVLGQPVVIYNIRSGRRKPGLQAQHLTCVNAVARITDAAVKGNALGSQELSFNPGKIKAGKYRFDVAEIRPSAGSVSLVFQAIFLPLAFADGFSEVTIKGGTHVAWSPPVHYLEMVYLPVAALMGLDASVKLKKWGWYPKGGGEMFAEIRPSRLKGIDLSEPIKIERVKGISALSNLPVSIAQRQQDRTLKVLKDRGIRAVFNSIKEPSIGPGTFLFIMAESGKVRAGFSSLGAKGKPAETVADEACEEFLDYLDSGAAVDPYMADQLIPVMALAEDNSCITTSRITLHLLTNIWVAEKFLPIKFKVEGEENQPGKISVITDHD